MIRPTVLLIIGAFFATHFNASASTFTVTLDPGGVGSTQTSVSAVSLSPGASSPLTVDGIIVDFVDNKFVEFEQNGTGRVNLDLVNIGGNYSSLITQYFIDLDGNRIFDSSYLGSTGLLSVSLSFFPSDGQQISGFEIVFGTPLVGIQSDAEIGIDVVSPGQFTVGQQDLVIPTPPSFALLILALGTGFVLRLSSQDQRE